MESLLLIAQYAERALAVVNKLLRIYADDPKIDPEKMMAEIDRVFAEAASDAAEGRKALAIAIAKARAEGGDDG